MKSFTLKIKIENDLVTSYDKHYLGGIDIEQRVAFRHLFPIGSCSQFMELGFVYLLAGFHGWDVEIVEENKK